VGRIKRREEVEEKEGRRGRNRKGKGKKKISKSIIIFPKSPEI